MMGTIAYMSPEQVRGEDLDSRSDIFSFGLVLYEMATGAPAFSGNTSGVIHEAILNRVPISPLRLNTDLPPKLGEIIFKALEKDAAMRYQNASDLRTDLKRLKRDTDSGRSAGRRQVARGRRSMNTARHGHILAVGLILILCGSLDAANYTYPLKIGSANPRILVDQNNVPFLMVGDSPHSMFSNLSSADAAAYLADRAARGINCLWVNMLCIRPVEGRPDASLLNGTKPFTRMIPGTRYYDLTAPNEAYFDHVAEVIQMAAKDGIVMMSDPLETAGWLPTALANGATRCRTHGRYLGQRYRDFPNIIWLHGNDFQKWSEPASDAVITAVARGIKDEDPNHLHTVELNYQASCSLDDPNWVPIVGLNLAYTYYATHAEVLHGYNQSAKIPVFMGEANFEYERNADEDGGAPHVLRMQEYWTMLSGATGQLYGNKYIWRFLPDWKNYLDSPGIVQLGYMAKLFQARKWYDLVPDQRRTFVTAGYGRPISTGPPATATTARFADNDYVTAALTPDGRLGMAYLPQGGTITVALSKLQNRITAGWFDPTNNQFRAIAGSPFPNPGRRQFKPPGKNSAGDPDWVLVLEAGDKQ